jgi:FHA domain
MSELQITYNGQLYRFAPGASVRIGRSSDNDIVVADPTVSRMHAQLSFGPNGWTWQNAGQSPTFLAGQPVAQFGVGQVVDVVLASPQGPALHLATSAQAQGPIKTELAAGVGLAGAGAPAGPPGYGPGAPVPGPGAGAPAGYGQGGVPPQ